MRSGLQIPSWRRDAVGGPSWQVPTFALLIVTFAIFRWVERREPWNSDDMSLFEATLGAAEGKHWALGTGELSLGPVGPQIEHVIHSAFRIGLLPISVPAVWLLGPTAAAYYVVPLFFSIVGFCALVWVARTHLGPAFAVAVAALHVAWPFELEHASLFLTDLPAAVCSLLTLCFLDASSRQSGRSRALCTLLAGVAAWETYLLRNNGLVLLGPAFLLLLWNKSTRSQTIWALAIAAFGIFCQQLLLVWRGLGWGYDWISVRRDFANYAPFLPVYSWPAFLVRQFSYQLYTFGQGVTGWLAASLMLGSLGVHLLLIRFERRPLLLGIALFGLSAWLVYTYSIYERVPGGVRATVPVNYRFLQPFAYSSLVAWAWAVWRLRQWLATADAANPKARLRFWATWAVPGALAVISVAALVVRSPETLRASGTQRLAHALRQVVEGAPGEPATFVGLGASVRVPRMFCCDGTRRVQWREYTSADLAALVDRHEPVYVLRDIPRELSLARYLTPDERAAYRAELDRAEQTLWRDADIAFIDTTYALFAPATRAAVARASANETIAPAPASFVPDGAESTCLVEPDPSGDGGRLVPTERVGRGWCQHAWTDDAHVLPASPSSSRSDDGGFVLRLRAEYDVPVSVMMDLVERSGRGTERKRLRVPPGTSYVPLPPEASERSVSLVYRVRNGGVGPQPGVRVHRAEWRPQRGKLALGAGTPGLSAEP